MKTLRNHIFAIQILIFGLLFFCSCKKDAQDEATTSLSTTAALSSTPVINVPLNSTLFDLGTGSGNLVIDGSTLKLATNSLIRIAAGTYQSITIKNITATAAHPVFIKNNGQVNITDGMSTENINNVTIAGDYVTALTYGFQFSNVAYRAISMTGQMNGVTIKSMSFKNIGNYTISGDKSNGDNLAYAGTSATSTERFRILYCLFDNAGSIVFGGALNKDLGIDNGFFKTVEIAYNTFQNSPGVGSVCSFTNVQDYNIHHNVVNNINQNNNNHNGVFFMQGNGIFHDNLLTNYQGNSIRMWLYSRGSTPTTNLIYNNICYNTRKYSGFELQGFDRYIYPGKSTYANARVYNNTVGMMNTSKDWEGQLLDLYNYTGTLAYYNNLGYNLYTNNKITDMINNMSTTKIITKTGNVYLPTQTAAVLNTTTFGSKIAGVGASLK